MIDNGVINPGSRAKKTKLPSGANSTRPTTSPSYSQYVGPNPLGMYNNTGVPVYDRNPWSGALDAANFQYPEPIIPRYSGAWDARNSSLWNQPATNVLPTYTGPMPTRNFGSTVNPNPFSNYNGPMVDPNYPVPYNSNGQIDASLAEAAANVPGFEFQYTPLNPNMPASAQPIQTQQQQSVPTYEPSYEIDMYGNPIDQYWSQNNANSLQWNKNGQLEPRPGVPEAYAMRDIQAIQAWEAANGTPWTSSYSPSYYANLYVPDRFRSASYGPDGQKRKAAPQDPYSFKNRQRPNNTNKHRGAPPDNMTTTTEGGNLPAWAGDLVNWRT